MKLNPLIVTWVPGVPLTGLNWPAGSANAGAGWTVNVVVADDRAAGVAAPSILTCTGVPAGVSPPGTRATIWVADGVPTILAGLVAEVHRRGTDVEVASR